MAGAATVHGSGLESAAMPDAIGVPYEPPALRDSCMFTPLGMYSLPYAVHVMFSNAPISHVSPPRGPSRVILPWTVKFSSEVSTTRVLSVVWYTWTLSTLLRGNGWGWGAPQVMVYELAPATSSPARVV